MEEGRTHLATIVAEDVLPIPGGPASMRAFLLRSLGLPPPFGLISTFSPFRCIRSLYCSHLSSVLSSEMHSVAQYNASCWTHTWSGVAT